MRSSAPVSAPAFIIQLAEEGKITPDTLATSEYYTGRDYPPQVRDFVCVYSEQDFRRTEILGAWWEQKSLEQVIDEELG